MMCEEYYTPYLPNVEIKDYNIMINGENVFNQPIKNNKVTYENIRKIATGQGDDFVRLFIFCRYLQNDCSRFKQTTS